MSSNALSFYGTLTDCKDKFLLTLSNSKAYIRLCPSDSCIILKVCLKMTLDGQMYFSDRQNVQCTLTVDWKVLLWIFIQSHSRGLSEHWQLSLKNMYYRPQTTSKIPGKKIRFTAISCIKQVDFSLKKGQLLQFENPFKIR